MVRDPGSEDAARQRAFLGNREAPVVEPGSSTILGPEQLVLRWIQDDSGNQGAPSCKTDRDSEMRNAVEKVGRAVERVDEVLRPFRGTSPSASFFEHEFVIGIGRREDRLQHFL